MRKRGGGLDTSPGNGGARPRCPAAPMSDFSSMDARFGGEEEGKQKGSHGLYGGRNAGLNGGFNRPNLARLIRQFRMRNLWQKLDDDDVSDDVINSFLFLFIISVNSFN